MTASLPSPPPRCAATFHVGVTGHRELADADPELLAEAVRAVLSEVIETSGNAVVALGDRLLRAGCG